MMLCGIAAQAQTDDYHPLVREGVRWHYASVYGDRPSEVESIMYFEGDSIVNGISYKKCISKDINGKKTVVALVRERDKIVYSIGGSVFDNEKPGEYENEIILYDFNAPSSNFPSWMESIEQTTIEINGVSHNCYSDGFNKIIEGIGIDGSGTLVNLFFISEPSTAYCYTGLAYVEENDRIIYKGNTYDNYIYYPLVREGVRWHTAYIVQKNPDLTFSDYEYVDHKIEFRGDTVLAGIKYKKCYIYESQVWTPDAMLVGFARDAFSQVMFVPAPNVYAFPIDDYYSAPGEYFDLTGERIIYDFRSAEGYGPSEWVLQDQLVSIDTVFLGSDEVTCFIMNDGWNEYRIVEGVGCDKSDNSVCPIVPFVDSPTGNVSRWGGLIMLTDLDENVLYRGAFYHEAYELPKYDLNHDGVIDIADVNLMINVLLGYDVPTGNQGHDTMPAATAEKLFDVTGDELVDIADVNDIINKMLGK